MLQLRVGNATNQKIQSLLSLSHKPLKRIENYSSALHIHVGGPLIISFQGKRSKPWNIFKKILLNYEIS